MKTLEEVRAVFPTAKHAPKEGCYKCDGEGMFKVPKVDDKWHPCICVFVDHEHAEEMGKMLGQAAREIRNDPQAMKQMVDDTVGAVRQFINGGANNNAGRNN